MMLKMSHVSEQTFRLSFINCKPMNSKYNGVHWTRSEPWLTLACRWGFEKHWEDGHGELLALGWWSLHSAPHWTGRETLPGNVWVCLRGRQPGSGWWLLFYWTSLRPLDQSYILFWKWITIFQKDINFVPICDMWDWHWLLIISNLNFFYQKH